MKLLLVSVALFAYAQSAFIENERASVERNLENLEIYVTAKSERSELEDEKHLIATLAELEKVHGRNVVADALNKLLEDLRVVIINGHGNIPSLDPFNLPHFGPLQFSTAGVRVTANIHDLNAEGLRWFVLDSVTLSALQLALGIKVTVPRLSITGSYDAHAAITLLSHSAGGNFRIFLNRLDVSADCRLGTSIFGGFLFLRNLEIDIFIHDIRIQIEGMVGSSILNGLINSFVQNTAQTVVSEQLQNISNNLSQILFEYIDDVLRQFTLDDLLNSIAKN